MCPKMIGEREEVEEKKAGIERREKGIKEKKVRTEKGIREKKVRTRDTARNAHRREKPTLVGRLKKPTCENRFSHVAHNQTPPNFFFTYGHYFSPTAFK